jgi:hypothetical protein
MVNCPIWKIQTSSHFPRYSSLKIRPIKHCWSKPSIHVQSYCSLASFTLTPTLLCIGSILRCVGKQSSDTQNTKGSKPKTRNDLFQTSQCSVKSLEHHIHTKKEIRHLKQLEGSPDDKAALNRKGKTRSKATRMTQLSKTLNIKRIRFC